MQSKSLRAYYRPFAAGLCALLALSAGVEGKAAEALHAIQADGATEDFDLTVQVYQGGSYDLDRVYFRLQRKNMADLVPIPSIGFEFTQKNVPANGSCVSLGALFNPSKVSAANIIKCRTVTSTQCPAGMMTAGFGNITASLDEITMGMAVLNLTDGITVQGANASLYNHALRVFSSGDYNTTLGCGLVSELLAPETLLTSTPVVDPKYLVTKEKSRFQANAKADLLTALCVALAFRNLFYASSFLLKRTSRLVFHWMCFIAAASQFIAIFPSATILIVTIESLTDPCDPMRFIGFIFGSITTVAILTVQFFKARSANPRSRMYINWIGIILSLVWVGNFIATCVLLDPSQFVGNACFAPFEFFAATTEVFWMKVGVELLANLILGGFFLTSLWHQRQITGLLIYDELLKEGVVYSLLVCSSNIICPLLYVFSVLSRQSIGFYSIDFAIATTLCIQQLRESRTRSSTSVRRKGKIEDSDMPPTPLSTAPSSMWARSRFSPRRTSAMQKTPYSS